MLKLRILLKEELSPENDPSRGFQPGDTVTKAVKKQELPPEKYTTEQIKKIITAACSTTPNIKPEFAIAVAFRESSLNPLSGKGSYKGVFSVGPAAVKQMGYEQQFLEKPNSVVLNIYAGIDYLQYLYERMLRIADKYRKVKFSGYVLTYIAYNLGYNTMLDIVSVLMKGTEPSQQTIDFIIAQSPRFEGNTPKQTVQNYYKEIASVFGKF